MTEQSQLGPSEDGTVVLDIGEDVGALIITTGSELHLAEIELSRPDGQRAIPPELEVRHAHEHTHADGHTHSHAEGHGPRTHVAVRERRGPDGVRYAAIYPGLYEGEYTVWGTDGSAAATVHIVGGGIAQLDWS